MPPVPLFARKGRFGTGGAEKRGGEDGVVTSDGCFAATLTLGGAWRAFFCQRGKTLMPDLADWRKITVFASWILLGMAAVAAYRPVSDTFSRISGGGRNKFIISSLDNPCTKPSGPSRGLSCPTGPAALPPRHSEHSPRHSERSEESGALCHSEACLRCAEDDAHPAFYGGCREQGVWCPGHDNGW